MQNIYGEMNTLVASSAEFGSERNKFGKRSGREEWGEREREKKEGQE